MLQAFLNLPLVLAVHHVDKIDDNQAAQVSQAQLAGYFICGFKVGLVGRVFNIRTLGGAGGIDVD